MRILVTGYEPFGGSDVNPSAEIARGLDGREIAGAALTGRVLPVRWFVALREAVAAAQACDAEAVLMFGQAGLRTAMSVERIGINVCEGMDNAGEDGAGRPIVAGGPDGMFSRLPIHDVVAAMRSAGIPAEVSNSAGTYLCNHAAYGVPQALAVPAGFIHVPMLPEQVVRLEAEGGRAAAGRASMPLDMMLRAAEAAVAATVRSLQPVSR